MTFCWSYRFCVLHLLLETQPGNEQQDRSVIISMKTLLPMLCVGKTYAAMWSIAASFKVFTDHARFSQVSLSYAPNAFEILRV
jgi:hypothetical protein